MIHTLSVGPIGENVYIIENRGEPVIVVDPGAEASRILEATLLSYERSGAKSVAIMLTHGHLDHVAALQGLIEGLASVGIPTRSYAPEADRHYFGQTAKETNERVFASIQALAFFKKHWTAIPEADEYYGDGFSLPGADLKVIHTPGHTRGSSCFLVEKGSSLISGDTLFRDGRGRTDNEDADETTIIHSVRERLCTLHDAVRVWPGHGEQTTIGREKPYYI
ncbi:MAG: MBL fold metallo-hydrolase [Spirochaetia bacterium]|jgi:glyoxylase-like metal-dependent hydrolase (beta-lactamase superfamily II)|nr:MBL fold metallo-hydrolase [Spirochaetia bacterium]